VSLTLLSRALACACSVRRRWIHERLPHRGDYTKAVYDIYIRSCSHRCSHSASRTDAICLMSGASNWCCPSSLQESQMLNKIKFGHSVKFFATYLISLRPTLSRRSSQDWTLESQDSRHDLNRSECTWRGVDWSVFVTQRVAAPTGAGDPLSHRCSPQLVVFRSFRMTFLRSAEYHMSHSSEEEEERGCNSVRVRQASTRRL
jgi:hypothetical protein